MVFYGDKSNWWAAYALWVFTPVRPPRCPAARRRPDVDGRGPRHHADVPSEDRDRLPGRRAQRRPDPGLSATTCSAHLARPLVDVRSPRSSPASAPTCRTTRRRARCAAATSRAAVVPWSQAADDDGRSQAARELERAVRPSSRPDDDIVAYCRIGERSSHTWFVLTYLLGLPGVRNYDGSWTEWGNTVRVPVAAGEEPGWHPERHEHAGAAGRSRSRLREMQGQDKLSCCWSSPTNCRRCQPTSKRRPWNRYPNASRRFSCTSTPPMPTMCGCTSALPPRHRPLVVSPSILAAGLDGQSVADILAVPDDFYSELGLAALISPLRLRGMSAMLARIKRQLTSLRNRSKKNGSLYFPLYCSASLFRSPITLAGTPPTSWRTAGSSLLTTECAATTAPRARAGSAGSWHDSRSIRDRR